ncbi:MAG: hypothetical protein L6Q76_34225, partial [Polyangiaceae bacterium]|nr:hypothetical protein [Polyangiaceae bacterium]
MAARKRALDLFELIVDDERAHIAFKRARDSEAHEGARQMMNELFCRMGDYDGNFVKDFQLDGFHSRLFELACYAYLESHGFEIERSQRSPDFMVSCGGDRIAIEAVTSNPFAGRSVDISVLKIEQISMDELVDKCQNEFPIRIAGALLSKLQKRYWDLP